MVAREKHGPPMTVANMAGTACTMLSLHVRSAGIKPTSVVALCIGLLKRPE
jgi:hypothetical protein